ncbi:hypothetical protein P775_06815 [Puniceibacterium antarcticum]|uniref:Uncharacterized protein n=1 Tax=Puniceibacterium antarcticum TaxID=1206336 RepID=A0A2G8RHH2_9RHOB|nr:hypothetical protein P775_06815 [Puniceibacterium antarcticum]
MVPEASFLNLYGLGAEKAVGRIANFTLTDDRLQAHLLTQERLATLFASTAALLDERERLRAALVRELEQVLSG